MSSVWKYGCQHLACVHSGVSMRVTSMKLEYRCPKCNNKIETSISSCSGSTEFANMFKAASYGIVTCAKCKTQNALRVSRLIAERALVLKKVILNLKCNSVGCGIHFRTELAMPLHLLMQACNSLTGVEGFNISCMKCNCRDLTRLGLYVGSV